MNTPINWQQFGLKNNPYDTLPLVEGGDISIKDAFVGRRKERQFLDGIFESEDRACIAVCGDTGVGKTSLTNFEKFIWKYTNEKLLFSFRREIEACDDLLNKRPFIIEILGSVVREIQLLEPTLLKEELFRRIQAILDISQSLSISGGLSGGIMGYSGGIDFGKDSSISQPAQISTTILEGYLVSLVEFIKSHSIAGLQYSGLIIHVNNFDVVLSKEENKAKVIHFFNEIRDVLQLKNTYFVFLGPKEFFREIIAAERRVKSIFIQTPLTLNPLGKKEVVEAFDQRMKLLKSENISTYIKPIEDEVVFRLYDLYQGDIRSIMSAIRDILGHFSEKMINPPLSINEAMLLLGRERLERIERSSPLTKGQREMLSKLVQTGKNISQKEASKLFGKPESNISSHYFKPLKNMGIIEEKNRVGKMIYWGLTTHYEPLRWVYQSQQEVGKAARKVAEKHPTLFGGLE